MKKILFAVGVSLISQFAIAQVYQCKVGGSLLFQDKPCTGSKEQADAIRKKQNDYKSAQAAREQREAEWAARKEPKIGMTKTEAYKSSWGYPDKENVTTSVNGTSEQWVYRVRPGLTKYLYFKNDILTTIQDF